MIALVALRLSSTSTLMRPGSVRFATWKAHKTQFNQQQKKSKKKPYGRKPIRGFAFYVV